MKRKLLFLIAFCMIFLSFSITSNACECKCKCKCNTKSKYEMAKETYEELFDELEVIEDEELEEWFIRYQKFANIYYPGRDTIEYFFTEDEIQLMLQVIETETYQATFIQKVNVANVLINRWSLGCFGGDITEIITTPNQFTYDRTEISEDTINSLNFAFEIRDTTNGSIAFRSDKNTPHTSNFEFEMYDGVHWFYKFKEEEL